MTAARSQEITPKPENGSAKVSRETSDADECSQLLDKTLDAFEKLQTAKSAVDAENLTIKNLLAKEQDYNQELLKAIALLTSSEKRNKGFFERLRGQLGKVLQSATDPRTISTIVSIILIVDRLKK